MESTHKKPTLIQDLGMQYPRKTSKQKKRYGIFKCFCGKEFKAMTNEIKYNKTKSCGCLKTIHGLHNHKLYQHWYDMKYRCCNSKSDSFKNYGERGISVCDKWLNDFMSFYNWAIHNGYKEGLTLDRKNSNGNYEPDNCRWTTKFVQAQNKRRLQKNNTSGYRGVSYRTENQMWSVRIHINKKTILLGYFKTALEGAKVYDQYVIDNNLEHTINGV